jgi:transposase
MMKSHVLLSDSDRLYLTELVGTGSLPVKTYRRVQALLWLHEGQSYQQVATLLTLRYTTVSKWAAYYRTGGEQRLAFLHDAPRSGRPVRVDGPQQAKLVALACSPAPEGYGRWSLRLLADRAVELGLEQPLSKSQVQRVLKKTNCSPSASASGA